MTTPPHTIVHSADGTRIAVHDVGGTGPPLLLAHGTGLHGLIWDRLAELFAPSFRVWAIDFRAHGYSDRPADGDLSYARLADDLLAAAGTCGGGRPLVFGHSLGGGVAVLAEAARPGSFSGMYLYEPAVFPPQATEEISNPMVEVTRKRRAVFDSADAALANFAGKRPFCEFAPGVLAAYVAHGFADLPTGEITLRCRPEDEAQLYVEAEESGAFTALSEVRCPVTVASGALDAGWPARAGQAAVRRLPGGNFIEFDTLGHFGPLTDADTVARSVIAALLGG